LKEIKRVSFSKGKIIFRHGNIPAGKKIFAFRLKEIFENVLLFLKPAEVPDATLLCHSLVPAYSVASFLSGIFAKSDAPTAAAKDSVKECDATMINRSNNAGLVKIYKINQPAFWQYCLWRSYPRE
jgi:hypothetical protein